MSQAVAIPAGTWQAELEAIVDELQGQELEIGVVQPNACGEDSLGKLHLQNALVEARGSERGALVLAFTTCCSPDPVLSHRLRAPEAMEVSRGADGAIRLLTVRSGSGETLLLHVPDDEPVPGRRRLSFRPIPDACTHPNCPVARPCATDESALSGQ